MTEYCIMDKLTQKIIEIHRGEWPQNTLIPWVFTFMSKESRKAEPLLYDISLVFITSWSKNIFLNEKKYSYWKWKFLFVSFPTPFLCEASLWEDNIFAWITLTITRDDIVDIAREISYDRHWNNNELEVWVLALDVTDKINNALSRLIDCCMDKVGSKVLWPMIVKEILFYALQEPWAKDFCDNILNNSFSSPLSSLITEINNNYHKEITVEWLAKDMNMSWATFYRHFKAFTGYSPIQYLKNLRLNKAKDFIKIYWLSVKETSWKVWYNSVSQFSREYKKYFGCTPLSVNK